MNHLCAYEANNDYLLFSVVGINFGYAAMTYDDECSTRFSMPKIKMMMS